MPHISNHTSQITHHTSQITHLTSHITHLKSHISNLTSQTWYYSCPIKVFVAKETPTLKKLRIFV